MARDGVLVSRGVFDHPMFREKREFSRLEAWVWMLAEAAWKPVDREIGGKVVTLKRGQFSHSIRFMADAWGWSKGSTERFLNRLKTEAMIGTDAGTATLVVTICNYERYQLAPAANGTLFGTDAGTAPGQHRDRLETGNQLIKESTPIAPKGARRRKEVDPELEDEFQTVVWEEFPRNPNSRREPALRAYLALDAEGRGKAMMGAMDYRRRFDRETDPKRTVEERLKFVPHLSTWINQKGWEVELERAH